MLKVRTFFSHNTCDCEFFLLVDRFRVQSFWPRETLFCRVLIPDGAMKPEGLAQLDENLQISIEHTKGSQSGAKILLAIPLC